MIEFDCPKCHQYITAADKEGGSIDICPKCNSPVTIPDIPMKANSIETTTNTVITNNDVIAPVTIASQTTSTKQISCPFCAEMIPPQSKQCVFCGELLEVASTTNKQRPPAKAYSVHKAKSTEFNGILFSGFDWLFGWLIDLIGVRGFLILLALVLLYVGGWGIVWKVPAQTTIVVENGRQHITWKEDGFVRNGFVIRINRNCYGLCFANRFFDAPMISWILCWIAIMVAGEGASKKW